MTSAQFEEFLKLTLGNAASKAKDGAIAFVCMDWRHMRELLDAGEEVFTELKNLCVWNVAFTPSPSPLRNRPAAGGGKG
jgi:hypothetical protein